MKASVFDIEKLIDERSKEQIILDPNKCNIVQSRFNYGRPTAMRIWPEIVLSEDTGKEARLIKAIVLFFTMIMITKVSCSVVT